MKRQKMLRKSMNLPYDYADIAKQKSKEEFRARNLASV